MSWQQPRLQQQHRQAQQQQTQQYRNGGYVKGRGERPGGRNQDRDIGNVRGNPDRRLYGRGGGERPRERDGHREYVLERERGRERNCNDKDRHGGGEQKRYPQYTEHDGWERRGRVRSRSQSRDSDDDDHHHPRRRR